MIEGLRLRSADLHGPRPVDYERIETAVLETLERRPLVRFELGCKRVIDVVVSLGLLLLLLPVFVLVALAVRLGSRGPAFFRQARDGLRGSTFLCLKFRSMYVDHGGPPQARGDRSGKPNGVLFKVKGDPRVTPFGSLIRRTSVDELPQLVNVLKGDMSLVGPRPLVTHMMAPYPELRKVRGLMRPGITGLWQVRDRANNSHVHSMEPHDLEYLLRFSLLLDLKILIATVPAVVLGRGAV